MASMKLSDVFKEFRLVSGVEEPEGHLRVVLTNGDRIALLSVDRPVYQEGDQRPMSYNDALVYVGGVIHEYLRSKERQTLASP